MVTPENRGPLMAIIGTENILWWERGLSGPDSSYFKQQAYLIQEAFSDVAGGVKNDVGRRIS